MKNSLLGQTGVRVSRIALGTATFGIAPTAEDADPVVSTALDLGINFVDTADVYGNMPVFDRPGAKPSVEREPAEQIFGRALQGRRDEMVIATKSNGIVGHGVNDRGLSRRHIIDQVEMSAVPALPAKGSLADLQVAGPIVVVGTTIPMTDELGGSCCCR